MKESISNPCFLVHRECASSICCHHVDDGEDIGCKSWPTVEPDSHSSGNKTKGFVEKLHCNLLVQSVWHVVLLEFGQH